MTRSFRFSAAIALLLGLAPFVARPCAQSAQTATQGPGPGPAPAAAATAEPAFYPLPTNAAAYAGAIAQARTHIADTMAKHRIVGLSVAVARNGAVVWSEGFGLADVEQGVPVTPLTRFRIGSVSKVLTAAAVGRLVESGRLDLDAPVQRYVPSFPSKPWPITTRQLAGHLAGIRHYRDEENGVLKGAPHFSSVTAGLALFANDPLLFEPGTKYSYSSYGWNLVAAAIEGASKQEFLTVMQREVFDPLGLRHTGADHPFELVPNRTRFYRRAEDGRLLHEPYVDSSYKWAGGGFLSTAEDLVRFGAAHLRPGFLKAETLAMMQTTQHVKSGEATNVGIAWRIGQDAQGRRVLHHRGAIAGGRTILMLYPESQTVVAIMANMYVDVVEPDAQRIGSLFIPATH